jgi:hypothetical protein
MWLVTWAGRLLAAFSVSVLIWRGLELGLSAPIKLALEWHNQFLHLLLGWAEPLLTTTIAWLSNFLDFRLELNPNWKHFTFLLWLYFVSDARALWGDDASNWLFHFRKWWNNEECTRTVIT